MTKEFAMHPACNRRLCPECLSARLERWADSLPAPPSPAGPPVYLRGEVKTLMKATGRVAFVMGLLTLPLLRIVARRLSR